MGYWIGLNSLNSWDMVYSWSDETETDFTKWASNEPNGWVRSKKFRKDKLRNKQGQIEYRSRIEK